MRPPGTYQKVAWSFCVRQRAVPLPPKGAAAMGLSSCKKDR
jgi:hypothetical protein